MAQPDTSARLPDLYFVKRRKLAFLFAALGVIPLLVVVVTTRFAQELSGLQIVPGISLIILLLLIMDLSLVGLAVAYVRKLRGGRR